MVQNRWELGSEFHWPGIPQGPFLKWPEPHIMFASGRASLLSIFQILQNDFSKTLFVPDYFCQEVATWWVEQGIIIKRYTDGPHLAEPVWETLAVSKGDAVLSVNYFGVRDGNIWDRWRETNDGVLLIEDHSHDPVSGWALSSKADFAFASLRKTFPVPDGGILWSPKGLPLPDEPACSDWRGSALKLAAMILKKEYLEGKDDHVKEIFRSYQVEGEFFIGESQSVAISPWSRFLLSFGYPIGWRESREENVRTFLDLIDRSTIAEPLFTNWPMNHCPFNAVLLFSSKAIRDKFRLRLIDAHIYPTVHWELSNSTSPDIRGLSGRILTFPVDHRYAKNDINRVAEVILNEL